MPKLSIGAKASAVAKLAVFAGIVAVAVAPAVAAPVVDSQTETALFDAIYRPSLVALTKLLVTAVLIESALTVIFQWRLFKEFFVGLGVRTLVMIGVSALAVKTFNIGAVRDLMVAYGYNSQDGEYLSFWLTALILAGGSAGVYNILVALGFRDRKDAEPAASAPPEDEAWVSVRVVRRDAVGPVCVSIDKYATPPSPKPVATAAVLVRRPLGRRLMSIFMPERDRFPSSEGHLVVPGQAYRLEVAAYDSKGARIPSAIDGDYVFANRAVLDFEVAL